MISPDDEELDLAALTWLKTDPTLEVRTREHLRKASSGLGFLVSCYFFFPVLLLVTLATLLLTREDIACRLAQTAPSGS